MCSWCDQFGEENLLPLLIEVGRQITEFSRRVVAHLLPVVSQRITPPLRKNKLLAPRLADTARNFGYEPRGFLIGGNDL